MGRRPLTVERIQRIVDEVLAIGATEVGASDGTSNPEPRPVGASPAGNVYGVGVIRWFDQAGAEVNGEVGTYVEGGPGQVSLIAMSDGTVRWVK